MYIFKVQTIIKNIIKEYFLFYISLRFSFLNKTISLGCVSFILSTLHCMEIAQFGNRFWLVCFIYYSQIAIHDVNYHLSKFGNYIIHKVIKNYLFCFSTTLYLYNKRAAIGLETV